MNNTDKTPDHDADVAWFQASCAQLVVDVQSGKWLRVLTTLFRLSEHTVNRLNEQEATQSTRFG